MTAKEYLSQALNIDRSINSKLEQVASLHELATKATTLMSDMPGSPNRNIHKMEDAIVKMVELEDWWRLRPTLPDLSSVWGTGTSNLYWNRDICVFVRGSRLQ